MLRGIYTSAMGMQVQEMRQEAISNNLANVQTGGFKRHVMAFSADHWGTIGRMHDKYVATPKGFKDTRPVVGFMRGGSMVSTELEDWQEGPLEITDNPLDFALREPQTPPQNAAPGENTAKTVHMFTVMDAKGNKFYTKSGAFTMDPEGYLVTRDGGYYVLVRNPWTNTEEPTKIMMHRPNEAYVPNPAKDGYGIDSRNTVLDNIPNPFEQVPFVHMSGQVQVDETGFVSIVDKGATLGERPDLQSRPVGWLVVSRVPVDGVIARGKNVFSLSNDLLDPNDPTSRPRAVSINLCVKGVQGLPTLKSGALERSNVSTVKELVALLAANRIYEMNSRTLKAQDELLGRTVSDVGRSVR